MKKINKIVFIIVFVFFFFKVASASVSFDSSASVDGSGTSATLSLTTSGVDRALCASVYYYKTSGTQDQISGVTYNSVSMVKIVDGEFSGGGHVYLYCLVAPTIGTHDIVASASASADFLGISAVSYTGASQTSQFQTYDIDQGSYSLELYLDLSVDGSWISGFFADNSTSLSALSGTTLRGTNTKFKSADSNAPFSIGTNSLGATGGASMISAVVSISPVSSTDVPDTSSVLNEPTIYTIQFFVLFIIFIITTKFTMDIIKKLT